MKKNFFILSIFIFCIGICCLNNYPDNDFWARLIVGSNFFENFSILKKDFLSYTPTHNWYDHEWGASIIFYFFLKYFGTGGIILLKGILSALTVFISYKTVAIRQPKYSTSYNILYYAVMFLAAYNIVGISLRCLLFTCLFFALFLYILEIARYGNKKILFILPIIMVIWCNIHGGCISGLGLIGIYCIGEFLNKTGYKEYLYTLLGCVAALFINPYGFEYVKFLFFAAFMDRSYITEWQSPFSEVYINSYFRYKFYLIFMLFIQFCYLIKSKINYKNLDKTKFIVILVMAILSVLRVRHITFFIFTAGTLLYDEFYYLFNSVVKYIRKKLKLENIEFINSFCLAKDVIIYFILLILSFPPLISAKEIRITETKYPRYAIEFIKINNLKGNLFINFDWGSYAAYKLYPDNLIVMDGRYEEVYSPDLILQLKDFHLVKNDWYKIIRDYKTDIMVIEKRYPVYYKILEHPDWKLIFENNLSGVFVPTKKVKENYLYPVPDDEYYNNNIFKSYFYKK